MEHGPRQVSQRRRLKLLAGAPAPSYAAVVTGLDRARLRSPRPRPGLLARPVLTGGDGIVSSPVVVIEADAGYGKTTLADQFTVDRRRVWYSLSAADRDPLVFLAHVSAGIEEVLPRTCGAVGALDAVSSVDTPTWPRLLDDILDQLFARTDHLHLVLDDYHAVAGSRVDDVVARLIERLPPTMHLVIVTRREIAPPTWIRARAAGQVRRIGREDLAFSPTEIADLFRRSFGVDLTSTQADLFAEETEGWPIGLHMLGQQIFERGLDPEALLGELPDNRAEVFAYLGDQVLHTAPAHVSQFLLDCSCLEVLEASVCASVSCCTVPASAAVLHEISRAGLFCSDLGGGLYRLHHLFREFLRAQLSADHSQQIDQRAAAHYRTQGRREDAARHSLHATEHDAAADDLAHLHTSLIETGRYLTLLSLTDQLPEETLDRHPILRVARSNALRLTSRYPQALSEASRAQLLLSAADDISGQYAAMTAEAMVYLDTVQPAAAAAVLRSAGLLSRRLLEPQRAAWRALVAENFLNAGRLDRAEQRYGALPAPPGGARGSTVRLLVRRGDLHRACAALESRPAPEDTRVPHSHREDAALLSWIYALLGRAERAEEYARRGAELGVRLNSPILDCLCTGRLGFALLCRGDSQALAAAADSFHRSVDLANAIRVPRFRAEPLIGLTIHAGRTGDFGAVLRFGHDAIETLLTAGDQYLAAMAKLAVGVGGASQNHPSAAGWLRDAAALAQRCGDAYLPLIANIWLGHLALRDSDHDAFRCNARDAMTTTALLALDDVWINPTWLGLPERADRRCWLQTASAVPGAERYSEYLLARMTPSESISVTGTGEQPAPRLEITTLGVFTVRQDGVELDGRAWKRRKAKEILWLLCSREHHSVTREEAMDTLWPDDAADTSNAKFRVALHALRHVLEPKRSPRSPSEVIGATADRIYLNPDIHIDLDEFRTLAKAAGVGSGADAVAASLKAIDLYRGPFIAEAPYTDWLRSTRDATQASFIDLCDQVARAHLQAGKNTAAAALARRILDEDPYRESAYHVIAEAHLQAGDRAAAERAYSDCRRRLYDDLGVQPSWVL